VTAVPLDDELAVSAEVQGVLIGVLEARNGELAGRAAELKERLARLERAVSQNSGNSSMPPSADDLPGKTAPQPRPPRGNGKKRQGKQRGAPGARPRDGWEHAMIARAAKAVRHVSMLIRALVITAAVLCADETTSGPAPARRPARSTCWWPAPRQDPAEDLRSAPLRDRNRQPVRHPRVHPTAAKHGESVITAIRDALAGNPWMPPTPDCA
jgi:Family of unknown function (DUF6444)